MADEELPPPVATPRRVFYVAGPGDAVKAHQHWVRGEHDPTEVSITFSSQIEQYCKDIGAELYIVCYHGRVEHVRDGSVEIEHLPKPKPNARGLSYHARELQYGLQLLERARRFGADVAILDSGCTHFFWQSLFAAAGIKVVPVLHNALWPSGFRPRKPLQRAVMWLDKAFWRRVPLASIGVSPECCRQVVELAGDHHRPLLELRAQFHREYFAEIPPAPPHDRRPFRIMFIGRVVEVKGVLDIVEMAARVEAKAPGRVRWDICGTGHDFEELKRRVAAGRLEEVVHVRGWTDLDTLREVYTQSHASIVPTRSGFTEGLAMTAAEAILAGRPVITNPVVPALEVLRPAAVAAKTDDVQSYVDQILKLIDDPQWYARMVAACPDVAEQFYDREQGLTAVLHRLLGPRN